MKIGQIAPLMESVQPRMYGGTTERIVSYLTEELVRMGHEVMLFASGDSITSAQLVGWFPQRSGLIQAYRSLIKRPLPLPDGDPDLSVVRPIMKSEVN